MEWLHSRIFSKFIFSSVGHINCLKSMFDWLSLTNSWCPCAVLWAAHQWDNIFPRNFQYYRHTWWLEGILASLLLHSNQVGFCWIFCHKLHQRFTTFTDTEVNNCFSIYHTSWITSGPKSNFICENIATKAILFPFGCSEVNSTWLITSERTNQCARKVLFTCVVYTNLR